VPVILLIILFNFFSSDIVYSEPIPKLISKENNNTYVKNYSSYIDSSKNIVVVGHVMKQGDQIFPQNVTVGMNVYNNVTDTDEVLTEKPYRSILYKNNDPFPFKFVINSTKHSLSENSVPFIYKSENVTNPFTKINTFELNYPVIPQGPSKELYGNITNTGPLQINNLTLLAIARDNKSIQVDSVKTLIPIIKPYETISFTLTPNPAIKDRVHYYTCVAGDAEDMMVGKYKMFTISNFKALGYKHSSLMMLDALNYNKSNHQLNMKLNNVYPTLGFLSLQLMPKQTNPVSVYLDGQLFKSAKISYLENMMQVDMSIPQGSHEVVLSNVEEY
jgi:hypothetical protein